MRNVRGIGAFPVRRLGAVLLVGCFVATLAIAFAHNHLDRSECQQIACVHCSGALAASPDVLEHGAPPAFASEAAATETPKPELPFTLRLDHSGGAPPQNDRRGC